MGSMSDQHRRVWCGHVAKMVYPIDPARCGRVLVDYLPLLADLPDEAFTPHSAEAVALFERRMAFPSFDEIAKPLRGWWRENRPHRYRSLPAPEPEAPRLPTEAERAAQAETMRQFREDFAHVWRPRPGSVEPKYLTGEALAEFRRKAGIRVRPVVSEVAE